MDDDDEDFTEGWVAVPLPGRKFQAADLLVIGSGFVEDIFGAVARAFRDLGSVMAGHANYRVERDRFHEQAAREIETMIAGEDD